MKNTLFALSLVAFGSSFAFADSRFADIRSHAARVEQENREMARLLKSKQWDNSQLQAKLEATGQDLDKIKALVAELEGASDSLSPSARKDWDLLRQKVQLLEIFHGAKKDLLSSGNAAKQRALLRAHAEGVAKRAAMLQQTAGRLATN